MPRDAISALLADQGIEPGKVTSHRVAASNRPIYEFAGPVADAAVDLWRALREGTEETGYWPLICGEYEPSNDEAFEELLAEPGRDGVVASILAAAMNIDVRDWFDQRLHQYEEDQELEAAEDGENAPAYSIVGTWPKSSRPASDARFAIAYPTDPGRTPGPIRFLAVPTVLPWQVLAYVPNGLNDSPQPEEHVAIHRSWHARFGTEIVGMTPSAIEMRVARPPETREEATALAWEQYFYCENTVVQRQNTIAKLAATLLDAHIWYFRWD